MQQQPDLLSANAKALQFYIEKLRYQVDEISPEKGLPYQILSKLIEQKH